MQFIPLLPLRRPMVAFLLAAFLGTGGTTYAQSLRRNSAYESYINKYKDIAVGEMKKYHIPASITLAQGLLESGAGQSELARKSNNHFGIKCADNWTGRRVYHDDDARGECFRAYKDPKDSYEDHSKFLRNRSRYASLFSLKTTDYKGWAHGLKRAGYATDPRYATRLIDIIETYQLHRFDSNKGAAKVDYIHEAFTNNGLLYVRARQGESLKSIGKEFDLNARKLRDYNELYKGYTLQEGDIVYLEKKKRKAAKGITIHTLKSGESMHSVAQKYGIRMKNLYKMNRMTPEQGTPKVGTAIRVR